MKKDSENKVSGSQVTTPSFRRPQVDLASAASRDRRRSGRQLEIMETTLGKLLYYRGIKQPARRLQVCHFTAQHWYRSHATLQRHEILRK